MNIATTIGYDATGANVGHLPRGQHAAYVTGSGSVPWSAAQLAADPGVIQIDQAPVDTPVNELADVLDIERGAATLEDLVTWVRAALANFHDGARPGQRSPAVYCSRKGTFGVSAVVKTLNAAKLTGIGLWIADWNNNVSQATTEVGSSVPGSGNPYPVIGRQYRNAGSFDVSIFSVPWLTARSVKHDRPQAPPGQWLDPSAFTWGSAVVVGNGLDGKLHSFRFNPTSGGWDRLG